MYIYTYRERADPPVARPARRCVPGGCVGSVVSICRSPRHTRHILPPSEIDLGLF